MSLLEVRGLSVRFGGHLAVNAVDLDVDTGGITGLIGPNGAGKTTIFNALCGIQDVSAGKVVLDGVDITRMSTHRRAQAGVARTFQRLEVFGSLTVRENLLVAAEYRAGLAAAGPAPNRQVDAALERVGLGAFADKSAGALPTGLARLVELGRALVTDPKVLLLDEPASGLDEDETRELVAILSSLAESGTAVLLVEHDMPLVMSVCSVINVLDFGTLIAVGAPGEIQSHQAVLDAYLGVSGGTA